MTTPSDDNLLSDIIRRARQGDLAAMEALVRQYQAPVRAWVATRRLSRRALA